MHEHADRDHTEPPACHPKHTLHPVTRGRVGSLGHDAWEPCNTPDAQADGEDAAALTALADALDTTPEQLAAGPGHDERRHRYATALDLHSFTLASTYWQRFVLRVMAVADAEQAEQRAADIAAHERYLATKRALADEQATSHSLREDVIKRLGEMLATERAKVTAVEALILCSHVDCSCGGDRASVQTRELRAALAGPEPETTEQPAVIDAAHLQRQRAWSHATFGPGTRTAGVTDHISRELLEIEADPHDLNEWVDVAILALDGAWRAGWQPQQIIDAIIAKQTRNEARTWPDWRTADPDRAIEHVRDEPEPCPHTCSCTSDQECPHDCPCEGGA